MNAVHEKRKQYLFSKGLNPLDSSKWSKKWNSLKSHAPSRGSICNLTFEQYMELAIEAGLTSPDQIGTSIDSYHMGRIGDIGDYEVGNCRFITHRQNLTEQKLNGGTESMAAKQRQKNKHNNDGTARQSKALSGRTKENHLGVAIRAEKVSKHFIICSPDGTVYDGRNVREFCLVRNLCSRNMQRVCAGKQKHHKGWTGKYIYFNEGNENVIEK